MRKEWIQKMNEMLQTNPYTDNGRVAVDYCENAESVLVTVCGATSVIKHLERFTEYGLMMKVMQTISVLYNA